MEFKLPLVISVWTIFCIQFNFPFSEAIVGSEVKTANPGEFTYVVSFKHVNTQNLVDIRDHICTASLISTRHVLCSAKCIENRLKNETVVLAGSIGLITSRLYTILWWINYKTWSENYRNFNPFSEDDISITKLNEVVEDDITPGVLSPLKSRDLYGASAVIAGWGKTNDGEISNDMLTGVVNIITLQECHDKVSNLVGYRISIPIRYLCSVAYPYLLLRDGDFGGPIIVGNMIVGVNKETTPLPQIAIYQGKVNIHTGIDSYRDFITDTTRNNFYYE